MADPDMSPHPEPHLVVGIGASAGGIAALKHFFEHVPANSGLSYVVILHLSPSHDSQLAEVLQTAASIPVSQVTAETAVAPDHVYVIPPNQSLSLTDGHLTLSPVLSFEERRAPVDIFFRTLAESKQTRAVSVILSGTGPNGSMGLKRVKERGGLVIAQDLNEAEHGDMPRNAVATGLVDHVLPVREIPAKILSYAASLTSGSSTSHAPHRAEALQAILNELRSRTGHDFAKYKRAALLRRVERRMIVNGLPDLDQYAAYIAEHPDESSQLLKELLISVTNFFRDAEAWAALEQTVIPRIFQGKGPDDVVRAWVTACATGEEAYTLGMLLADHALTLANPPRIQMFATDIDAHALSIGRHGLYSSSDVADVPPERLRKYFTRDHEDYRVRSDLREPILFAVHNVLKDPPFSALDIVTCRNLLIYLNNSGQERVLETLHFALKPGGWLVLGSSESVSVADDLFVVINSPHRIAQSRAVAKRLPVPARQTRSPFLDGSTMFTSDALAGQRAPSSFLGLHQRLLETYAAPSIVINEACDIVHLSPHAGQYLQVPGGEPSQNLLVLIRPELRAELRTAVHQAIQQRSNVQRRGLRVDVPEGAGLITLQVRPVVGESDAWRGFLLVVFEDASASGSSGGTASDDLARAPATYNHPAEDELIAVRAQLRASVEACEMQAEEFKAAAEEQQALNEELRSVAEELETSKEELQSVNEELTSVNQELKSKVDELGFANSNIRNLIDATDIASVFLDRSLRVRLYTPRAKDLFNLIPADVGRPLMDLTNRLEYEGMWRDLETVMERLQMVEREVRGGGHEWYLVRLLPYRSREDRIEGVVLTFIDITERTRSADLIADAQQGLALAQQASDSALWLWDLSEDAQQWSVEMCRLRGWPPNQPVRSEHYLATIAADDRARVQAELDALLERRGLDWVAQFRVATPDGTRWIAERGRVVYEAGQAVRIRGIDLDVTARRVHEDAHARLASLVDLSVDSIVSFDFDGAVVTWNSAAAALFEYSADEVRTLGVSDVILPAEGTPDVLQALRDGRVVRDFDTRGRTKSGHLLELSVAASPVHDPFGKLVGGSMIVRDLSNRHRSGRRKYDPRSGEHETEQVRQIVAIQEEERSRIARDLHDHFGQELTALRLSLASLKQRVREDDEVRLHIEQAESIAARLDTDVDFLAYELRPSTLDDEGLAAALERYLSEWAKRFGVKCNFHATGVTKRRLSAPIELTLYRITQEALNNVAKHAAAQRVDLVLEHRDRTAVLIVEDDGRGFEVDDTQAATVDHRLGLIGMRERAAMAGGTIAFESSPGQGSTVIVRIPLSEDDA